MKKRMLWIACVILLSVMMTGCGGKEEKKNVEKKPALDKSSYVNFDLDKSTLIKDYKVALLSQSETDNFYLSAKKGLDRLSERLKCETEYANYDKDSDADYENKVKTLVDSNCKMIWVLGDKAKDINIIAEKYPDVVFSVVDEYYDAILNNVLVINFKVAEASFMAGYAASSASTTGKVAIMYTKDKTSDEYIYGYKAGAKYADYDNKKKLEVTAFETSENAKQADIDAKIDEMIKKKVDVIFASTEQLQKITASKIKTTKIKIIGVDANVMKLAPDNAVTYTLKLIDSAVELVSFHAMSGDDIAGVAYEYGVSEGAVELGDISDTSNSVTNQMGTVKEILLGGEVVAPVDEESYKEFLENSQAE